MDARLMNVEGNDVDGGSVASPAITVPPETGLMPSTPFPGHPAAGFRPLRFVTPWLKGLVAMGSRMPCAAEVG